MNFYFTYLEYSHTIYFNSESSRQACEAVVFQKCFNFYHQLMDNFKKSLLDFNFIFSFKMFLKTCKNLMFKCMEILQPFEYKDAYLWTVQTPRFCECKSFSEGQVPLFFWMYNGSCHPFANILKDYSDEDKCKLMNNQTFLKI